VPLRLVLGQTAEVAVVLLDVVAYSTGLTLRLAIQLHHDAADIDPHQVMMDMRGRQPGSRDDALRFGVEFSDGRKATNLGPRFPAPDEPPPRIRLVNHGGGGGSGHSWRAGYWVYPLPTPGPLTLAIAWLGGGIPEHTHTIDADPIIDAAALSTVLWKDNRTISTGRAAPGAQLSTGSAQIAPE